MQLDPTVNPRPPPAPAGLLAEIAASLTTDDDLGLLLQRFLDPIVRLAHARAGAVRVLSAAGDELRLVGVLGVPGDLCSAGEAVDRHCGHCGAAVDGQQIEWAADVSNCAGRTGKAYFGQDCRRLLAVPLQHRGRTLGVYTLFFADAQAPSAEVLALLRTIGELLGMALNNARLEQERQRATLMAERQSMAAEIHDSVAQSLAFAKMRMPLLHDAMLARDDTRAQQYYDDVRRAMTQAHASLRGILTHFRAPHDPQGLVHALGASVEAFRRNTGTELDFVNDLPGLKLPAEQETHVFHIVQEALTNVARHSQASHARLHMAPLHAGEVEIVVEDDGTGLPAAAAGGAHYGLEIMVERARLLGGALEVGARQGGGTRLRLVFPLPQSGAPGVTARRA